MTVSHSELVSMLKKNGTDIIASLTQQKADAWHMASCIMGEAAELYEAIRIHDDVNVIEELGDIEFYLEGLRQAFDIERRETLEMPSFGNRYDLPGASGNVFDAVKKFVIYNKDFDRAALIKALSEFEGVMKGIREQFGISYLETLEGNIAKLSVRYKGLKYSDQAAQTRADKA